MEAVQLRSVIQCQEESVRYFVSLTIKGTQQPNASGIREG